MSMLLVRQATNESVEDTATTMLIECAWCGRERRGERWRKIRIPRIGKRPPVSHGICPECLERQMERVRRSNAD